MKFPYILRNRGVWIFFLITAAVVGAFLYFSSLLVADLSDQERSRMQIWADATRELAVLDTESSSSNVDFLLSIIEANDNIPVLLTDDEGSIVMHRNFDLPQPGDSLLPFSLSTVNRVFLERKLDALRQSPNVIHIVIEPGMMQHLYYEDSRLLRRLSLYPYVQIAVMIAFILVVYFAVTSSKKAEQNKVWVGLSKETAHQLGTPISSLMAWLQLLESEGIDPDVVKEMDKDVTRLSTIASRFSKIGSQPSIENENLNDVVGRCVDYMRPRISSRVTLSWRPCPEPLPVDLSSPLIEWVMENLMKNAVDAMEGVGSLAIETSRTTDMAVVEITDSGKGIPRKLHKQVFSPGFTTKKRGWGLGLTLARRIIHDYHSGRIAVKWSEPGKGTTFRIELPIAE